MILSDSVINGRPRGFGSDLPNRVGPGSGVATSSLRVPSSPWTNKHAKYKQLKLWLQCVINYIISSNLGIIKGVC